MSQFKEREIIHETNAPDLRSGDGNDFYLNAAAKSHCVNGNGSLGNDSWTGECETCGAPNGPKKTNEAGIEAIEAPGDVVSVAPGTYTGALNRDLTFYPFSGGGLRHITVRCKDVTSPPCCIIDCQYDFPTRGFNFDWVNVGAELGRGAVVDGFAIERCDAGDTGALWGGGILISDTDPIIRNCTMRDNFPW